MISRGSCAEVKQRWSTDMLSECTNKSLSTSSNAALMQREKSLAVRRSSPLPTFSGACWRWEQPCGRRRCPPGPARQASGASRGRRSRSPPPRRCGWNLAARPLRPPVRACARWRPATRRAYFDSCAAISIVLQCPSMSMLHRASQLTNAVDPSSRAASSPLQPAERFCKP